MIDSGALDRERVQRRTLWVLSVSVALTTAGAAAAFAAAAVLGEDITGSEVLGSIAAAGLTIGTAAGAVPLARVMDAHGRRPGFRTGLLLAGAGGLLVTVSAIAELYPVLLVGALLIGVGNAVALAARFAAADLAPPSQRGRAIGFVVWAATLGAVLGPAAGLGGGGLVAELVGLPRLAGVYAFVAISLILAAHVVQRFLHPDPLLLARAESKLQAGRTASMRDGLMGILDSPLAQIGAGALVVAHVVMIGIMTVTPLHLHDGGGGLTVIGLVISVHILGMYAFSPVVGWMTDRLGALPMVLGGGLVLITSAEIAATSSPHDHAQIFGALFLLGLGWNFELVSSSSIITSAVAPERRVAAQGLTDLVMNSFGAAAGIGAGFVIGLQGFDVLGHVGAAVAATVVVAGVLGLLMIRSPSTAPTT